MIFKDMHLHNSWQTATITRTDGYSMIDSCLFSNSEIILQPFGESRDLLHIWK